MPATPLATVDRYLRVGHTHVIITPEVADSGGAATRAEINAGISLQNELQGVTGFTQQASQIDTPDWASRVVTNIPGLVTMSASSLTLYADKLQQDIRQELAMDDDVVVIFMDDGDVEGRPMDVFPAVVNSVSPNYEAQAATLVTVSFTLRDVHQGLAIPAAA